MVKPGEVESLRDQAIDAYKKGLLIDSGNYEINFNLGACLLYTSDAADDLLCVDLGGRRIIKKKKNKHISTVLTIFITPLKEQ